MAAADPRTSARLLPTSGVWECLLPDCHWWTTSPFPDALTEISDHLKADHEL